MESSEHAGDTQNQKHTTVNSKYSCPVDSHHMSQRAAPKVRSSSMLGRAQKRGREEVRVNSSLPFEPIHFRRIPIREPNKTSQLTDAIHTMEENLNAQMVAAPNTRNAEMSNNKGSQYSNSLSNKPVNTISEMYESKSLPSSISGSRLVWTDLPKPIGMDCPRPIYDLRRRSPQAIEDFDKWIEDTLYCHW
jgi:hypothetical protein